MPMRRVLSIPTPMLLLLMVMPLRAVPPLRAIPPLPRIPPATLMPIRRLRRRRRRLAVAPRVRLRRGALVVARCLATTAIGGRAATVVGVRLGGRGATVRRLAVEGLDLRPQRAGGAAVAAVAVVASACMATAGSGTAARGEDVVLVVLDGVRREEVVEAVAVGRLLRPLADRLEHLALNLDGLVARGWVVEGAQDIVDDLVDGDRGVFPGVHDPAGGGLV